MQGKTLAGETQLNRAKGRDLELDESYDHQGGAGMCPEQVIIILYSDCQ